MALFDVTVTRTSYAVRTIKVEADSESQAYTNALDEAGNHVFSEHAAKYYVECVLAT